MLSDAHLQDLLQCVEFTRRNAPVNNAQLALIASAGLALEAEIKERQAAKQAATTEPAAAAAPAQG